MSSPIISLWKSKFSNKTTVSDNEEECCESEEECCESEEECCESEEECCESEEECCESEEDSHNQKSEKTREQDFEEISGKILKFVEDQSNYFRNIFSKNSVFKEIHENLLTEARKLNSKSYSFDDMLKTQQNFLNITKNVGKLLFEKNEGKSQTSCQNPTDQSCNISSEGALSSEKTEKQCHDENEQCGSSCKSEGSSETDCSTNVSEIGKSSVLSTDEWEKC
jgi:hypothetical protein